MLTEKDVRGRMGPMLSDGTMLTDLVDLEKREVSMRVYSDPEIFRLEMDRVFARNWTVVAHECEIPNPGDFVLRYIGRDQVIVNRSADGEINIMLNVCAHRGMGVCFADEGNESTFRCRFHGWLYNDKGSVIGAPFDQEMYDGIASQGYKLDQARVGIHQGLIFATFGGSNTPEFDEWLGDDARHYLDLMYGGRKWRMLGAPVRQICRANWKIFGEQSFGDAYHVPTQHLAPMELGLMATPPTDAKGWGLLCTSVMTDEGHAFIFDDWRGRYANVNVDPTEDIPPGGPGWQSGMSFFPGNLQITCPWPGFDGELYTSVAISRFIPVDVDTYEFWAIELVDDSLSDEQATQISNITNMQLCMTQPDDIDCWEWVQRAATGAMGARQTVKYNATHEPNRPDDWDGPGTVYTGFHKDDEQWSFWVRWLESMTDQV